MSNDEMDDKRLAAAVRRHRDAVVDERLLTERIEYHAEEASRLRKLRQKVRNKKDRADAAILRIGSESC